MKSYKAQESEAKWQKEWKDSKIYEIDTANPSKEKFYNLAMFPYPSGSKLHLGHWYNYGGSDIYGRFMRLQGYSVFQPMGFDSFGLPAENYAIKTGTPPAESTNTNIKKMIEQLGAIGGMWDWNYTVATSTPEYYKWTQWLFLKLYENDLAYRKNAPVNWCPSCNTVLANEQVVDGECERCDSVVTKKDLTQWFFRIKKYADDLLNHEGLDWPQKTVTMQKNWIGKSVGSQIKFNLDDKDEEIEVYTTRIDTLFGCTYVVLAPEHKMVMDLVSDEQKAEVEAYIEKAKNMTEIDRTAEGREKTGVFLGCQAINPATGKKVPVWIADYALAHYGTGAVMAVPTHDQRDFEFAAKFGLEMIQVIESPEPIENEAYVEYGKLMNSGEFDGLDTEEAKKAITEWLDKTSMANFQTNYRLHDWLVSRQRYWGAPIPIVYDPEGKPHMIPEEHLPWELPTDVDYNPKGESPLATSKELLERTEKIFGKGWTPEVDTLDTFVCSSWYYLRYPSANETNEAFNIERANKWLPTDMYIGGPEHACMHLLYARFINMALHDLGYTKHKEPFKKLVHQGLITKDGAKMSKSKGNAVSPDEFVEKFGSDVFRMYLMFMGPYVDGGDWNDQGITGIVRFRDKFWNLITSSQSPNDEQMASFETKLNQTIQKVGRDIKNFQFNTAIAALMEMVNFASKTGLSEAAKEDLCILIAPLAPHFAEEIWQNVLGMKDSIFNGSWPEVNESKLVENTVKIVVQINGKLRGEFEVARDSDKAEVLETAKSLENVVKYLEEGNLVKEIYVPNKLVSLVVK